MLCEVPEARVQEDTLSLEGQRAQVQCLLGSICMETTKWLSLAYLLGESSQETSKQHVNENTQCDVKTKGILIQSAITVDGFVYELDTSSPTQYGLSEYKV